LKSSLWEPAKKIGCLQIVENHQRWKLEFFSFENSDIWDSSHKPPIFLGSKNQGSYYTWP
jgi:hypothetical protein